MKRKLLDLFCGAGGAAKGYQRAGFYVVGVDIKPQPRYAGDEFHCADAMTFPLEGFDAIHASPPCQGYSAMSSCRPGLAEKYPKLIDDTRRRLIVAGVPWVMENVYCAPLKGIMLCGAMFGLESYRHRLFESNMLLMSHPHEPHRIRASRAGHWEPGTYISVAGKVAKPLIKRALDIDWMTGVEAAEAIPPAFTEFIGRQLMAVLERAA